MQLKEIIHVLYSGLGGHGQVFFTLAEADKAKEFSSIACFCGVEPVLKEYAQRCDRNSIEWYYFLKKKGFDLSIYSRLFQIFNKKRPNIIFLHGASFILPALLKKIMSPSTRIITRDTQAHHLKGKMEWIWLAIAAIFSKRIVFLTGESKAIAERRLGFLFQKKKFVVIPNGIDTAIYYPEHKENNQGIIIGMQSRLQSIKDHPTLIRAFKLLKEKFPSENLKLKIAGEGETRNALESLSASLGLTDDIEFTGLLTQEQLLAFTRRLDIYVHASFGETMSNSIMQAMSCGLPVIASDVWGINNMITHGKNGLLYESQNVTELADYIEELIIKKDKRRFLSENARQFAEENYSSNVMFVRYRECFINR